MTFLPSVVRAEYRGGHRIRLTFNDNSEKTVDFGPWLEGPVFEPLKDPDYFRRFFLDGGTVVWPNGADIAPETLYEEQGLVNGALNRADLPELEDVRQIVLQELPKGSHLESVDLTFGPLEEGQVPAFTVLVAIQQEPHAGPGSGLGYSITRRIRERWSRDDLYVKLTFHEGK